MRYIIGIMAALLLVTVAQAGIGDHFQRLLTRFKAPRGGDLAGLEKEEIKTFQSLPADLAATIIWSSNRSGNHEIYLWDTRDAALRQLTRHDHVDYFGNFSPDGRKIVFSRSKRPWVSFREEDGWDVYVMDVDGSSQQMLASTGYMPTWSTDGRQVVFMRQNQIIQIDVGTGTERILAQGDRPPLDGPVQSPVLAADKGLLALILRQKNYRGPAVLDLRTSRLNKFFQSQACQTFWSDDQNSLLFIAKGGQGGTRVMVTHISNTAPGEPYSTKVLMDLPGPYSHEYFPRLDNTGGWLVWGAAAKGHEHDRADYELFLWQLGRPFKEALRLTHYAGNDQWPDIHVSR